MEAGRALRATPHGKQRQNRPTARAPTPLTLFSLSQPTQAKRLREKQASVSAANIRAAAATARAGNALRRESAYLCDIRFTASLPAPPGDPKALLPPLDLADLARFRLTDLEAGPVRDAPLGDVGAAVSLLEPERYTPGSARPGPLDPADAALVAAASASAAAVAGAGGPGGAPLPPSAAATAGAPAPTASSTAPRPGTELSWLMRTTYIHADTVTRAGRERGAAAAALAAAAGASAGAGPRASLPCGGTAPPPGSAAEAVEAEFAAAARPPVHPTKPGLKAVRVLPVLPDLEGWAGPGPVLVATGADPLAGVTRGAVLGGAAAARAAAGADTDADPDPAATARLHAWLASRAALKSYALEAPHLPGGRDTFLGFMVPSAAPGAASLAASGAATPAPPDTDGPVRHYDWVREFGFKVTTEAEEGGGAKKTFLWEVRPDAVLFSSLAARIGLHPRPPPPGEGEEGEGGQGFNRPSGVELEAVPPGEADVKAGRARLAALVGGEEDG